MGTATVLIALLAIIVLLFGLWLGNRYGRAGVESHLADSLASERNIAATREAALSKELGVASAEIASLRPKADELVRVQEQLKSEQAKYAQMKSDLDSSFKGAAADALNANTTSFLALAKQVLGGQAQDARTTLDAKELAIKTMLDPLEKTLTSLAEQTRDMEAKRSGAYSEVKTLVENIQITIPASLGALKTETAQLISALRAPKTRGNWGELQLKRCAEYAGMVQHCSFSLQVASRDDDDNLLIPDMTVRLPNGREIIVDAKTPLDAFLDATSASDPTVQQIRFAAHAQQVRAHLKMLSSKAYWKQFEKAPDFVVCFLPSEALFSAALEADPSLIEFSAQSHVVMATPTTLIALLRAVDFGWQQSEITENAKAIHELGRRIYDKLVTTQGHVTRLGNALNNSVENYNKFLGTIEGKSGVFFYGRKLGELVHSDEEIAPIRTLQPDVRELESEEWSQPVLPISADGPDSGNASDKPIHQLFPNERFDRAAVDQAELALAAEADDNTMGPTSRDE